MMDRMQSRIVGVGSDGNKERAEGFESFPMATIGDMVEVRDGWNVY
jgi:hypothetical protein